MNKQNKLEFPLDWQYKIITINEARSPEEIIKILRAKGYLTIPTPGNLSQNGKYQTYLVKVTLTHRQAMDELGQALRKVDCVKYII